MLRQIINSTKRENNIYDKSNNLLEYSVEPMIIDPFNSTPPDKLGTEGRSRILFYQSLVHDVHFLAESGHLVVAGLNLIAQIQA